MDIKSVVKDGISRNKLIFCPFSAPKKKIFINLFRSLFYFPFLYVLLTAHTHSTLGSDKAGADLQCNNPPKREHLTMVKRHVSLTVFYFSFSFLLSKKQSKWSWKGACLGLYASLIHIIIMFISDHYPCNI